MDPGGGTGDLDLFVDLAALTDLRERLLSIHEALAELNDRSMHTDATEAGDPDVADAVNHFVDRWRDGRRQIGEKITVSVKLLDEAVESYEKIESELYKATTGQAEQPPPH